MLYVRSVAAPVINQVHQPQIVRESLSRSTSMNGLLTVNACVGGRAAKGSRSGVDV